MPYFPFFIDIENKPCLIVGGGKIALHKIKKLLSFSPDITVVSADFCSEIAHMENLKLIKRNFKADDTEGMSIVIAATDDESVNSEVSEICKEKNILCNVVDSPEDCGFFFRHLLSAAISLSGCPRPEKVRLWHHTYADRFRKSLQLKWLIYAVLWEMSALM